MRSSGMSVARVAQFKQILSISFNSNFYPASLAGNLKTDNRHVALQIYLYIVYGILRGSGEEIKAPKGGFYLYCGDGEN